MAFAKGQIWITHWGAHEVGIWDPTTNAFTPEFSTPSNAGVSPTIRRTESCGWALAAGRSFLTPSQVSR